MADQKIVNYFNENLARGYPIEQIKKNLIQNGYNQKQVNDAAKQATPTNIPNAPSPPKSSKIVFWVVGIVILLVLLSGAGYYYVYKKIAPIAQITQFGGKNSVPVLQNSRPVEQVSDYSIFKDQITCGSGFIRHGISCCSDSNSNNICDVDDGTLAKEDELKAALKLNCGRKLTKMFVWCCIDTNENGQCDVAESQSISNPNELGLAQIEFVREMYECKAPYLKAGNDQCCLDINHDNVCDLPFDLIIKSVEAKHIDNAWSYRVDKFLVDYSTKKDYNYKVKFEAYDKNDRLVSADKTDMYFSEGAKTNFNVINYAKIEFQDPGIYTLKIKLLNGNNVEAGSKETKILVGTTNENPAGPQFSAEVLNFQATQQVCAWIYPKYSLNVQNKGDMDIVYALKKTYSIDGSIIKENTPKDDKPSVAKAGSSEKTDFSDMSELEKECYHGKTLSLKLEFFDSHNNLILTREAQAAITKKS